MAMRWRNPWHCYCEDTLTGRGTALHRAAQWDPNGYRCDKAAMLRLRSGARHACARMRRERDEARRERDAARDLLLRLVDAADKVLDGVTTTDDEDALAAVIEEARR